ncbi:MAG: LexA family transcriptional regulator [Pseudomonadota bacterium]
MSPQEKLDAGKRIASARKAAKVSQVELAKRLGVPQSVVSDWERGVLESWREREDEICQLLEKPLGYIRDQVVVSDQLPVIDRSDLPTLVEVPEYEVMLSAGPGRLPTSDETRRTWPLPRFLIVDMLGLDPDRTAMQEVIGDSMTPTLASGDFVLIDLRDRRLGLPGVFAVWDGDAVVCKRLERIPGGDPPKVRLKSDNPLHNEYEVLEQTVQVVGRIRFVTRRM